MRKYLIGVNYRTSELIHTWANSAREHIPQVELLLVDNFSSGAERKNVRQICEKLSITLILSENNGYGSALNTAFKEIKVNNHITKTDLIMAGNIDLEFENFLEPRKSEVTVYMPKIIERQKLRYRNRNPFITQVQLYCVCIFKPLLRCDAQFLIIFIQVLYKFLGYLPSKAKGVHGSLFCFNAGLLNLSANIFNDNAFLYCEEIEFAKFLETNHIAIEPWETVIVHEAHQSISQSFRRNRDRHELWKQSYLEFLNRWKL